MCTRIVSNLRSTVLSPSGVQSLDLIIATILPYHVLSFTLSSEDCANLPPEYRFGDNVEYQAVPNRAGFHC